MVRRRGFEKVRMQDVTADFAQMKRESDLIAARREAGKAAEKARPKPYVPDLFKKTPSTIPRASLLPTGLSNVAPAATKIK